MTRQFSDLPDVFNCNDASMASAAVVDLHKYSESPPFECLPFPFSIFVTVTPALVRSHYGCPFGLPSHLRMTMQRTVAALYKTADSNNPTQRHGKKEEQHA